MGIAQVFKLTRKHDNGPLAQRRSYFCLKPTILLGIVPPLLYDNLYELMVELYITFSPINRVYKKIFCIKTKHLLQLEQKVQTQQVLIWRRWRDSNPRYRKVQLISSQPRYDHFDTSPYFLQLQYLFLMRRDSWRELNDKTHFANTICLRVAMDFTLDVLSCAT